MTFSASYFEIPVSNGVALFSADDEPINITLHVPSTSERQDYYQPGNMMLLTRYVQSHDMSNAVFSLQELAIIYMS